ncbi:hypothetical protein PHLGIDRAFT_35066 [Phlebiopsis gigantea 11061_1 CR5-6]|uniref:Uncharacterized protein n=1 Tax=Phlebiopsis gigantea (strain 11061_1 CR5-6) TaxID=745531 RepID=A0A0C3S9D6_PHLG1|nr:hypothetical protein PHLGIDRAFT_35066 [Phlebiopsis gigantea 11061_1 CR5-6]
MDLTQRTHSVHSELGDLSDSDWLDIASSRVSEDDESVVGFDSDREDADGRPFSRHSFSSLASSSDEVVEGWEGLIEDSADETPGVEPLADIHYPIDAPPNDPTLPAEVAEDPEDERVKAALDQSMISTLSSSRSNSLANSLQTSIVHSTRSLRLSFPDPTTSRLESLSTSFEELPPSDAHHPTSEDGKVASASSGTAADPLRVPSPAPAAQVTGTQNTSHALTRPAKTTFTVVLYGSSLASKMAFVDMLLEKWALGSDLAIAEKVSIAPRIIVHTFKGIDAGERPLECVVSVVDKTGSDHSLLTVHAKCPSLAVVFLPSISDLYIPDHTLYLPVMMTAPLSPVDVLRTTDYLLEAEQQWEAQGTPSCKLTNFSTRSSPVVDEEILARASPGQVEQTLRALWPPTAKKIAPKVPAHAVTIMAILSIVLAYIMNGVADTSNSRRLVASAVTTPLMNLLRPVPVAVNKSMTNPLITLASSGSALSLTSFKDFQVSVFNPSAVSANAISSPSSQESHQSASTSAAASAATTTTGSINGASECGCGCGLLTWPAKTEMTDLMLRPTSSSPSVRTNSINAISVISSHTPSVGKGKGKAVDVDSSLFALSTRMATSLSEYLGFSPIAQAVVTDLHELIAALDQLADTITRQTNVAWEQARSVMTVVGAGMKQHNERARVRAHQLREVGGVWFASLKGQFMDRATVAKENARSLRHHVRARHIEKRRQRQAARQEKLQRKLEKMMMRVEGRQERRTDHSLRT